jgi:autotransporter-associated beta strand protein
MRASQTFGTLILAGALIVSVPEFAAGQDVGIDRELGGSGMHSTRITHIARPTHITPSHSGHMHGAGGKHKLEPTPAPVTPPVGGPKQPPVGGDPTWSGLGGNPNWNTGNNWVGGVAPVSGTGTALVFAGTTNTGTAGTPLNQNITTAGTPMLLSTITFDATAGNFFLGGNQIGNNNNTTLTITQSSSNSQSIANAITDTKTTSSGPMTLTLVGSGTGLGVVTLSGVISDNSTHSASTTAVTESGTGTFVLSGANTYTGGTTVNAGTLLANNATSSTGTGAVVVNNSGTLGGTGKITGSVTLNNSAVINAGTVGTVNTTFATGALTMNNTSVLSVDMTSTTADKINVTNGISLVGSTIMLQLNIPNGTVFTAGTQFTLLNNITAGAISGTFEDAPTGTDLINGYYWIVSYTGGDGNDFVLTAVPEPSTWVAGALALAAVGYTQRRRFGQLLKLA